MRRTFEQNGYEEPFDMEDIYTSSYLSDYLN